MHTVQETTSQIGIREGDRTARGVVKLDRTDWSALSDAERLHGLHVNGYTVLPALLDRNRMDRIEAELADLKMNTAPYSDEQKFAASPPQWHSRSFAEVIGEPRLTDFIKKVLGEDIVFMLGHYIRSGPGVPGLALHSDYQPYGSEQKGWNESSPSTIRILIYLNDLSLDKAPFTIVPGSHLSLHECGNPYIRYDHHGDMMTLTLNAGDALVFNVKAFHGTHPHLGDEGRGMLEYAYRPAWAKCAGPVEEWNEKNVAAAPEIAKPYLKPRNSGDPQSALGTTLDLRAAPRPGLAPLRNFE